MLKGDSQENREKFAEVTRKKYDYLLQKISSRSARCGMQRLSSLHDERAKFIRSIRYGSWGHRMETLIIEDRYSHYDFEI
ncbi:Uncharacterised protein [Legionella pneumophila]|nr:Uncharacterised protein [Legionella pneumophila]CZG04801.1 Uncharacterised protein [Legionella pneumophila]CZG08276.1 Uncharacterised protein [Legionella pneumophila]CZG10116.1 Uncharacterised protein [Legionella pneumophila]CZG16720.1 Uncharacterised protein [Legionella pneumophila]